MSKILWKALTLGSAVLGASLLVANSTLAAQKTPGQMAPEQKSSATTDKPIDLLSSLQQSPQEQHQPLKVNPSPVAADSTSSDHKLASLTTEHLNVLPSPVVADKTLPNKTKPGSAHERISLNSTAAEAETPTDETTPSVEEPTDTYGNVDGSSPMDQVTNVSQFRDVRPGDWAYEALRELVERYGCIAGYPDSTYRGNRAMTRYEFAAGLRACLNQIEKLIAASTSNFATKDDLEKLRRLVQEFQGELAALGTRVDNLEGRVNFLESHQFSTTTKLNAEVIFNVAGFAGNRIAVPSRAPRSNRDIKDNVIESDRVRLNFDTSFTGKDRLRTRLEANNTGSFNGAITGTNQTRLSYDGPTGNGNGNSVLIGKLVYRFPLTSSTTVFLDATGGEFYDNLNTLNPFLESSGLGSISRFGRFNPIYRISNTGSATNTGAGATVVQKFGDSVSLSGGYLARTAQDPSNTRGLINGTYGAIGQLNFQATKNIGLGLTYAHSYYAGNSNRNTIINNDVGVTGATGSINANQPFGAGIPTSTNAYGAEFSLRLNQYINISGWGGIDFSTAERGNGTTVRRGNNATSYNYAGALSFPDLGGKGNVAALIFGQPPRATRNDSQLISPSQIPGINGPRRRDRDTSYHIEGLYRFRFTNNIYVTPGVIVILRPEDNAKNSAEYVGVLRTTFTF